VTEEPARVLRPGHRIALGKDVYTVIQLNGTAVTLPDQHGELSAVMLGYLLTAPGFQVLDSAPPRRGPQEGRLAALSAAEQERVRWLEGHLIELETGQRPEQPPRDAYDPALHDIEEREQAKLAEFAAAGRSMTRRHLQRLRRPYRDGLPSALVSRHGARWQLLGCDVPGDITEGDAAVGYRGSGGDDRWGRRGHC
jgi:putative transposase